MKNIKYAKSLGEDFTGSIKVGMAFAKMENPGYEPIEIRLHPLDRYLSKYPYGWPPVVLDDATPRHMTVIILGKKGEARQPPLL